MYPVYGNLNSYPHQKKQTPSPPYYNLTSETFPPQINENQANTSQMHEHWPHNYTYPAPICQNCCSHGQHPSYYNYRPPCPHFLSPLPYGYGHYYGSYPAAYPPPPYPYVPPSMERPIYEHDKGSPNEFHCCECPNHPSHVKSTNNVKIEEHEPDVETGKAGSLVPARVSNSLYPIMWVPPEYMMNKERPKLVGESDIDKQRVAPYVEHKKPDQSIRAVEQDPNAKYQWLPLDMDSIKRLMEGGKVMKPHDQEKKSGDEKKTLGVEKKDQNKQFSYPITWMPYDGQQDHIGGKTPAEEQEEPKNNTKRPVVEHPSAFKVVKHPDEELVKERAVEGDHANGGGTRGSRKTGTVRVIPVKQLDDSVPKSLTKEQENVVNGNFKNAGETGNWGSLKNDTGVKPSCPPKKSKLPPICLRVDPPRKKNGKGSFRSPSPPGDKTHQKSGDSKEEGKAKESLCNKKEMQVKEVLEKDPVNDIVEEEKRAFTQERQCETEGKVVHDADIIKSDGTKCVGDEMHAVKPPGVKGNEDSETGAQARKILSETEAAIIIQTAYRGYAVRQWEPLKKLTQIADVREEAGKIEEQLKMFEASVTFDNKEKVTIGETIMNLLLKLDTIQGLHPSVREVRRSVAKELVMLQEKLDCIVSQVTSPTSPRSSIAEGIEENSTAFGSNEESAGPLATKGDASEIAEHNEAFNSDQNVEAQKDVFSTGNEEVFEVNEEPGRDPHNKEAVSPVCKEKKEKESDKLTAPENSSIESQETLADANHFENTPSQFEGSSNEDQEANMQAKSLQETVERQEDDICRMDGECDLGAAKITCGVDQETTQLAEIPKDEQEVDGDARSAFKVENVDDKHVQVNTLGEMIEENEGEVSGIDSNKDWEVDQPNVKPGALSGDIVTIEQNPSERESGPQCLKIPNLEHGDNLHDPTAEEMHFVKPLIEVDEVIKEGQETADGGPPEEATKEKCDGDVASALEVEKVEEKHAQDKSYGEVIKENKVDSPEVQQADQFNDKPQIQCEHLLTFERDHKIVESCEEEATGARESKSTDEIKCMEIPVIEVQKVVIKEGQETAGDGRPEQTTNVSQNDLQTVSDSHITELPISEGVVQECKTESSTSITDAQKYKDICEASPVSSNGEQIERRIIEENEKLRNMVEQLLASGKEQQDVISILTAKVKDLEKKMPKRNKMRSARRPGIVVSRGKSLMSR